jgi:serine beta-lactamase-like protein LACTB
VPVTSETVFRVGSITKLFTDMALMLAVQDGKISLDEPVEKYIPEFQPRNPFKTRITARHLVSHHSGLAREPPVGHYFDSDPNVSIKDTALSLNTTTLFHEPGTTFKYSNAAIAVVGLLLEKIYAMPWSQLMRELLLDPMGMDRSEFTWSQRVEPHLAYGAMYSQDNRLDKIPPFFELGEAPAGSLYSTTTDLEKFANMIMNGGYAISAGGNRTQIFKPETLDEIFRVQFPDSERKGVPHLSGIGWQLMTYAGIPIASHGGAIYGYTARFVISREKRFSVVLLSSGDCAITTIKNVSNYIIAQYGRYLNGETTFPLRKWSEISVSDMIRFEGAFIEHGEGQTHRGYDQNIKFKRRLHLDQRLGHFMLRHDAGYSRLKLVEENTSSGASPSEFVFDVSDRFVDRETLSLSKDGKLIKWAGVEYDRIDGFEEIPAVYPMWDKFVGEYGPDYAPVYVFERYGRLFVLLEWMMQYPLRQSAEDPNVWILPSEDCFYVDERLVFSNFDKKGVPMSVECTGMMFERRLKDVDSDTTFKISCLKSIEELRKEAMSSSPPEQLTIGKLKPDLVDMTQLDQSLQFDIRYATENNFMGASFYRLSKAFAQRPASQAILKAHNWLKQLGYGLVIFDIYRPWHVTKMFYEATPLHLRHFVAAPSVGSIHNRGCAIDCGLYELSTGKQLTMVSGFDEMTPRSYRDYPGGTTRQRWYQLLLRTAMQQFNFEVYEYEWWHFNFASQNDYPVMNWSFEELLKQ